MTQEEREDLIQINKIKEELQEQCKNCSFLEIINPNTKEIRCFYMKKNGECVLR